jgi:hypothetical protein
MAHDITFPFKLARGGIKVLGPRLPYRHQRFLRQPHPLRKGQSPEKSGPSQTSHNLHCGQRLCPKPSSACPNMTQFSTILSYTPLHLKMTTHSIFIDQSCPDIASNLLLAQSIYTDTLFHLALDTKTVTVCTREWVLLFEFGVQCALATSLTSSSHCLPWARVEAPRPDLT